jgi:hypothetical protein
MYSTKKKQAAQKRPGLHGVGDVRARSSTSDGVRKRRGPRFVSHSSLMPRNLTCWLECKARRAAPRPHVRPDNQQSPLRTFEQFEQTRRLSGSPAEWRIRCAVSRQQPTGAFRLFQRQPADVAFGFRLPEQNAIVHAGSWSSGECRFEIRVG